MGRLFLKLLFDLFVPEKLMPEEPIKLIHVIFFEGKEEPIQIRKMND